MVGVEPDALRSAVARIHGGSPRFAGTAIVNETFGGKAIWRRTVHVFDLDESAAAARCFAWVESTGETDRVFTMLQSGAVASAVDAVRAFLARESADGTADA